MSRISAPTINLPALSIQTSRSSMEDKLAPRRARSGSLVKMEKMDSTNDQMLDQEVYPNVNADWVNLKGAWVIHVVLIVMGKIIIDSLPGMTQEISWTLVNLTYLSLSYLMFHWVTGTPFHSEMHGGAFDDLTLWEQIDEGAQNTPAKKWLFSVPVCLFLASTHYTNYNPWVFAMNITALVLALIPKLPMAHRQRVRFMSDDQSGMATPVTPSFNMSGTNTPTEAKPPPAIHVTEAQFRRR